MTHSLAKQSSERMQKRSVMLVMLFMIGACERVTAPEARNAASKAERELARGNLAAFFSIATRMGNLGNVIAGHRAARNNGLAVWRDGQSVVVNAYVVENVYIPPPGFGKPIVHRALAAWPDTRDFALAVIAERHPSDLRPDTTADHYPGGIEHLPDPHPEAFARVHFANPDHRWIPRSGTVTIGDPAVDRRCDTTFGGPDVEGFPRRMHENVTCALALFEVRMEGDFTRVIDLRNPLLRSAAPLHRLAIASQRVPGIRFVTSCVEPPREPAAHFTGPLAEVFHGCWYSWPRFWRDNDLFAPNLNVDVTAMSRFGSSYGAGLYGRFMLSDSTKPRGPHVRWTLHRPDGSQFGSGSFVQTYPDPAHAPDEEDRHADVVRRLVASVGGDAMQGRVQVLVPAYLLDTDASRYAILVLHAETSAEP